MSGKGHGTYNNAPIKEERKVMSIWGKFVDVKFGELSTCSTTV